MNRRVFDVGHMWRLATRKSADFQKQSAEFHLTAQHFTHSAETFCLATREQQAKHAPADEFLTASADRLVVPSYVKEKKQGKKKQKKQTNPGSFKNHQTYQKKITKMIAD